jgi:hypothetical protein
LAGGQWGVAGWLLVAAIIGLGASCALAAPTNAHPPSADPRSPRAAPPSTPYPLAPSPSAATGVAAPSFGLELARLRYVRDPLNLVAMRSQAPRPGFARFRGKKVASFPGAPFAEIRAYAYRFSGFVRDDDVRGCGEAVIAEDGTFCPSVVARERVLSPEQADMLMALVRPANEPGQSPSSKGSPSNRLLRARTRCDFDPHHAFVWWSAAGLPVAELDVCFECGEWMEAPSAGLDGLMWPRESEVTRALCDALDLGGCHAADDAFARYAATAAADLAPEVTAIGVSTAKPTREASDPDRRRLCAWYGAVSAQHDELRRLAAGATLACEAGARPSRAWRFDDWRGCRATFPRCDATIAAVAACVSATLADPCEKSGPARACDGVEACTWGVHRDPLP